MTENFSNLILFNDIYIFLNEGDKAPKNRSAACPFNMFRSSNDIRAKWSSIMNNLHTTQRFLNVSRPGCWAYPDMLEVGVTNSQKVAEGCKAWGQRGCTLDLIEARTHFAAWCLRMVKMAVLVWPWRASTGASVCI